jgi:RNA-directed DNA polymerase
VRYADDLAVLCPTQEKAIEAQAMLRQWLGVRGLRLADEKTPIRHLRDGCNFLACNIRH